MKKEEAALFAAWEKSSRPYPWTEKQFLDMQHATVSKTLVYEEEGQLVGYAAVQTIAGELYLLNIMVNPEHQGTGKGEKLMNQLMAYARENGVRYFILDVDPDNTPAVNLYKKMGFEVKARRTDAYPKGEGSLVMGINL